MKEHLIRQYDLIPESLLSAPITIIGAGAIGGWTTLSLAKMGMHDITVFDFDKVSVENMNSQFYRFSDIGRLKVYALDSLIQDFTGINIKTKPIAYTNEVLEGIVICALDSMKARKAVFDAHGMNTFKTWFVIDPRMGAEMASLAVYDPKSSSDCETYKKSLYSDSEGLSEPCTAKATVYTASLISGLVVKAVKDILVKKPNRLNSAMWHIGNNDVALWGKQNEHIL